MSCTSRTLDLFQRLNNKTITKDFKTIIKTAHQALLGSSFNLITIHKALEKLSCENVKYIIKTSACNRYTLQKVFMRLKSITDRSDADTNI
jgi:hypothetical protein